ncbi:MAG TPA: hypothetical protein VFO55_05930 [Gemmatimonadaceae bacterium]|nr:hypothetical protein [Gemmatimonadaceae bacterium]
MKNLTRVAIVLATVVTAGAGAQQPISIQHIRPQDQRGVNMYEPSKHDTVTFQGTRVVFGGAFRQDFQGLGHSNESTTPLINLGHGFNNATANLNLDVQLAKGIRVAMTSYLSSRHHNETWVKDGYILMDASPIDNKYLNEIMSHTTLKVGHFEVNYGDGHFRRTDNGQAIFNPFVGNYILDAFTTEVGAEAYVHDGWWLAMAGLTNGEVKGATTNPDRRSPAFFGKLGVDGKPLGDDLRLRFTMSAMSQAKSANQTLYGGDRAGSVYYNVVEGTTATEAAQAWSGMIRNPFGSGIQGQILNGFAKYKGAELFTQLEWARGKNATVDVDKRKISQQVVEGLYRLGAREQFYFGGRYNNFDGQLTPGSKAEMNVSRYQFGGGWYVTKNLLAKGEWVTQDYSGFTDIRKGAKFDGFMFSGAVSF